MILTEKQNYDGSLIHTRFAYRFLRDKVNPHGDIVAFRGSMLVNSNLIDLEDKLSRDFIMSDDSVNFIWEIPNLCSLGAVAFQRLFNTQLASVLSMGFIHKPIEIDGDDLIVHDKFIGSDEKEHEKGKASVSITYSSNNVAIGHTGINIVAGKHAPGFAYSTNLTNEQALAFQQTGETIFYNLVKDMFIATTKVVIE